MLEMFCNVARVRARSAKAREDLLRESVHKKIKLDASLIAQ
jgi:hypothetical protein